MSAVSAINSSVDNAVASVKQQILLAQQSAEQQKTDRSVITPSSSDVAVRPDIDPNQSVEDITEVVEVDAPKPQEMLEKVRNVIPKLNSVMHSMNLK